MKVLIPGRLFRVMDAKIEVDVAERILERAQFVTRRLAADGGIVMPEGIEVRFYQQNPVVLGRHGRCDDIRLPVVGRSLGLERNALGMVSRTQFADTDVGRDYAYLYGVNEKSEVYARGWSFGWETTSREVWTLAAAKAWLGPDWDDALVPSEARRYDEVWVARASVMNEYSAVPVGADRAALSRAYMESGIRTAAEMVAAMDLQDARDELTRMRAMVDEGNTRIGRLEQQMQALSRDGAAAAGRGDSAALLAEIDDLQELLAGDRTRGATER